MYFITFEIFFKQCTTSGWGLLPSLLILKPTSIKWCHYYKVFVDTMFSHAEICSGWASYRPSWLDLQISVPRTSAANCCSPRSLQILHHYTNASAQRLYFLCTTCIHSYSFTLLFILRLSKKSYGPWLCLCVLNRMLKYLQPLGR